MPTVRPVLERRCRAVGPADRVNALRRERGDLLTLCEGLDATQWLSPSMAGGWTVQDVVAHIGSGCHAMFSPSIVKILFGNDIERANDAFVARRRAWRPERTLDEYRRWSHRVVATASFVARSPLGRITVPLAELGRFPLTQMMIGALVFDHHTHLRHDIAPALGVADPGTDANRMAIVIEWMLAVLANQMVASPTVVDGSIGLVLDGMGGGAWTIHPGGDIRAGVTGSAVLIEASAVEFPDWGTKRCDWRDRQVQLQGDESLGTRFLDWVNVV
jgi:uncharacterized protein (TIGR03083 family)